MERIIINLLLLLIGELAMQPEFRRNSGGATENFFQARLD